MGAFFKYWNEIREDQVYEIKEALHKAELEIATGLNHVLGLARAGDTRWGSH